jgi:hypothetical protein
MGDRPAGAVVGRLFGVIELYVMAAALISFVSVYLATESFREDLTEELTREPVAKTSPESS